MVFRRSNEQSSSSERRLEDLGRQIDGRGPRPDLYKLPKLSGGAKRTTFRILKISVASVLVVALGLGGYLFFQFAKIHRYDFGNALSNGSTSKAMTVLLVGSDTRSDLASGQKKSFGSGSAVAGQRSDTIMLLRVDPSSGRAAILSLPRDLWVPIYGTSKKDRINSSFNSGPQTLVRTITQDFNIPIDHYIEVNFDTFRGVVNAVGGVNVPLQYPVRDHDPATGNNFSGLDIRQTGCVRLDGNQALSYVRSRHYQVFENGRWRSDPLSDFGRIQRQQDFVRRVAHKAVSDAVNPLTFKNMVNATVKNLTVDKNLSATDMVRLANRLKSLDPNTISMQTMPTTASTIGGADVLLPEAKGDQKAIDDFLNGPPATTTTTAAKPSTSTGSGGRSTATTAPAFVPPATPSC